MDELEPAVPLGARGRLEAQPLTNTTGDHALLVREAGAPRLLLTAEAASAVAGRERVVLVPLDDDVEVRMDGDALAVWLASGSVSARHGTGTGEPPAWASAIGLALVVVVIAFAVLGGLTFFGWLAGLAS